MKVEKYFIGIDFAKPTAEFTAEFIIVADVPINIHKGSNSIDWEVACSYLADFLFRKAEYENSYKHKSLGD